jgi:hypothetical protein
MNQPETNPLTARGARRELRLYADAHNLPHPIASPDHLGRLDVRMRTVADVDVWAAALNEQQADEGPLYVFRHCGLIPDWELAVYAVTPTTDAADVLRDALETDHV